MPARVVAAPARSSTPKVSRQTESRLFAVLNRLLEAPVRKGFASPSLAPGGLIVLETKGRRTGRRRRVPLAAMCIGGHVLIGTFRGRTSQWIKNLAADGDVQYWVGGRPKPARATVIQPDDPRPVAGALPHPARPLLPFLELYRRAGWAFAVLAPRRERRATKNH